MEVGLKLAQSLECPVCLSMYEDPKILSCSHSFCKTCLDRLAGCHGEEQKILCPVCRVETQVPRGDTSLLQTNLAVKSLLEDVKIQSKFCSDCPSEARSEAVVYCQECGKYLCVACQGKHSDWDKWNDHEVLDVNEIASGKQSVRKYRKCNKHPREDEECFCADCRRFACFRCIIKEHANEKHAIMEGSVFAVDHRARVEEYKSKSVEKSTRIRKYIGFIDEQKGCIHNAKKQCIDDISQAFEESVKQLTEQKESLLQEVMRKNDDANAALEKLKDDAQQQVDNVSAVTELVANGTKIPLGTEALAAHDLLCQRLQEHVSQKEPQYNVMSSIEQGKCIAFERKEGSNGLGKIANKIRNYAEISVKTLSNLAATLDGGMALGYRQGGIAIFSPNGHLRKTVLQNVGIRYVEFLSDGRYVVLDNSNIITLYTTECEKLDVRFDTLSNGEALYGRLSVGSDDLIYINYARANKIQVFSPAGGKPIREIPFRKRPAKITACNDSLIISDGHEVSVIDKAGKKKCEGIRGKEFWYPFCTVTHGQALLVAWVKYDGTLVTIDEYTLELKYVKTLISEFKIEKPQAGIWYYLQEFRSGEIALSSFDKLYIFH